MTRLEQAFDNLHQTGRKALLPYITAGYPDVATTRAILQRIAPDHCAAVELGIPFSDPIADGPVIQTSFSRALDRGFRLAPLLEAVHAARDQIHVPLLAMVSYSIVYRKDPQRFVQTLRAAGIDGMIVPDLALEEAADLSRISRDEGCALVMIIAPTSTPQRRQRIAELSHPFIYYQSLAGVTGERNTLPTDLTLHIAALRRETGKPICVGFGISTPDHVKAVCRAADGAIVGSAIVRRMNEAVDRHEPPNRVADVALEVINELITGL